MYDADPEVIRAMLAHAPLVPRLLMPHLAPRVYARYVRRVHGTTTAVSGRVWRTSGAVELVVPADPDARLRRGQRRDADRRAQPGVPYRGLAPRRGRRQPRRRLPRQEPGRLGGPLVAPLRGGGRRPGSRVRVPHLPERLDVPSRLHDLALRLRAGRRRSTDPQAPTRSPAAGPADARAVRRAHAAPTATCVASGLGRRPLGR